ncbi:suppressor of tub2 mutation [Salix suchowensis]|nr:suppressor of tub2 mutation [Salix suchowensis]
MVFENEKNVQARGYAIEHLKTYLEVHAQRAKVAIEASGGADILEKAMKKGLVDQNPAVRDKARLCFWQFYEVWKDQGVVILDKLDMTARKQLEKVCPVPDAVQLITPATTVKKSSVAAAIAASRAKQGLSPRHLRHFAIRLRLRPKALQLGDPVPQVHRPGVGRANTTPCVFAVALITILSEPQARPIILKPLPRPSTALFETQDANDSLLLATNIPIPEDDSDDGNDSINLISFSTPFEVYPPAGMPTPKSQAQEGPSFSPKSNDSQQLFGISNTLSSGSVDGAQGGVVVVEEAIRARAEQAESAAERLLELVEPEDEGMPVLVSLSRCWLVVMVLDTRRPKSKGLGQDLYPYPERLLL